ncbi:MAG: methylaspartate mutase subunit E [Lentisphaerae bacterium]|nr:methylaspartate mutase subunit E [Lentisphaerota bacterium]MCP4101820.1 methylaspartate mutase subunit E [Lentisphaerota bacterium]
MKLYQGKIPESEFMQMREGALQTWPTGQDVDLEDAVQYQRGLPDSMNFAKKMHEADQAKQVLLQPRAGVALVEEHIQLLKFLEPECDLLPTTIDAYTRLNQYNEAQRGIEKSKAAGQSLLNGFPAVNHGIAECRRLVESLSKPVEIRHGTPDARLLAEISFAAGFTSYEGGGISYNIPYAKKVTLEHSISCWQYIDRLVGYFEEQGVRINREPFGPLSGTLVPPFASHTVAILEGLMALEQGVRSITLGYGQAGNMIQDIAAMMALRELADEYFQKAGYNDYELSTVLHQWMGGFPEDQAKAFSVITWGGTAAALAKATKVIVKTPHEAFGIPTKEANLEGLKCTRQIVNMLADQEVPETKQMLWEVELIKRETRALMDATLQLGNGNIAEGAVRAFQAGVIDIPFAPSLANPGKMMPVRDNHGAIRILDFGKVPIPEDIRKIHKELIQKRADIEKREASFQMVIDDIYSISKGRLVGRPR